MLSWFKLREHPEKRLKRAIGNHTLPAFSSTVLKTLQLLRDVDSSTDSIADQISLDPGLSVKVLGMANSSTFALKNHVATIRHAVSLLGRSSVESAVLGLGVNQTLTKLNFGPAGALAYWTISAERALLAGSIGAQLDPANSAHVFTAALLQDLAVPLLCTEKGAPYEALLQRWYEDGGDLADLEQSTFGWNHAHLGGWLCRTWQLPNTLADAVGAHHQPDAEIPSSLLLVANWGGGSRDNNISTLNQNLCTLGLGESQAATLVEGALGRAAELASLLAL